MTITLTHTSPIVPLTSSHRYLFFFSCQVSTLEQRRYPSPLLRINECTMPISFIPDIHTVMFLRIKVKYLILPYITNTNNLKVPNLLSARQIVQDLKIFLLQRNPDTYILLQL